MDKQNLYLQTITETHPGLDIHSARLHTADGQFNDILFINDDLLFRFPRYEESEIEVLQKLQGQVSLPIPEPTYINPRTRSVGKVFLGYRLLPGQPLFREVLYKITNESTLESFAQQLAGFLHSLHHLSPGALGLNLPVPDPLAESKAFFQISKRASFLLCDPRPAAR